MRADPAEIAALKELKKEIARLHAGPDILKKAAVSCAGGDIRFAVIAACGAVCMKKGMPEDCAFPADRPHQKWLTEPDQIWSAL